MGRFVVIDDECDGLDSLPLFQPDADVGLSYEIVVGVERYLTKETDETMRANLCSNGTRAELHDTRINRWNLVGRFRSTTLNRRDSTVR